MYHFVAALFLASADYEPNNIEAKANKQRRKVQNRKNQRLHRLRNKSQSAVSIQPSRAFQVERWNLDEVNESLSQVAEATTKEVTVNTSISIPKLTVVVLKPPLFTLTPPPMVFSLSADHLLHLVQYNVFRAFSSNKRTLNALLKGWSHDASSTTCPMCPISFPYTDDTNVFPLNPNIPPSLFPTRLQQERVHSSWINLFPFPSLRDNLIRYEGQLDHWELLQDLIGEFMGGIPVEERQGTPVAITLSDPKTVSTAVVEDEVTAGRKGLIVWGEPHDMRNWEATPGFLVKWAWAVQGCEDLLGATNRWRGLRGEEPLRLPALGDVEMG